MTTVPPIDSLARDWKTVRARLAILIPGGAFSLGLGATHFGWLFLPIALAVLAATWVLLWLIERVQIRRASTPEISFVLNASIGRRPGRLHLNGSGMKWWPYADRHGDPELVMVWTGVDHMGIEPVAAFMPLCRLRASLRDSSDVRFEMSMGPGKLRRVLEELLVPRRT